MISSFLWKSFAIFLVFVTISESACTFPSEITGDWYSAYKGKLSFNSTHLLGYPIYMSASQQSLDFECYINRDKKYVLRATETALVFGQYIRGYLCIELLRVSSTKYYYYHRTTIAPINNDHIIGAIDIVKNGTLDEICDLAEPYRKSSFVMLVKEGSITTGESASTCATDLLASYRSVTINGSTESTSCSSNTMDGCTQRTEMRFTYAFGCGKTQKFSANGIWTCVHSISSGGYTFLSLWNNDRSVVGTTSYQYTPGVNFQFACLVISASSATMYPNYCSDSTQTATTVAPPGLTMSFSGATRTCCKFSPPPHIDQRHIDKCY
ncbi:uncharacterized protein LOC134276723 [Saccostrea cucullata]|uniref:uncharacterized protein LOC134276723 n=1 Tax=Saccostrea cuccullata TaxID=36930 RepID=UPI002ED56753